MLTEKMDIFFNQNELANGATYTPNGATPTAISCLFDRVSMNLEDENYSEQSRATTVEAEITVKKTDVTSYSRKDTFEHRAGEIWHPGPEGIIHEDESIYIISLQREV